MKIKSQIALFTLAVISVFMLSGCFAKQEDDSTTSPDESPSRLTSSQNEGATTSGGNTTSGMGSSPSTSSAVSTGVTNSEPGSSGTSVPSQSSSGSQSSSITVIHPTDFSKKPRGVQESARVGNDYFDDAVFIGDSVSLKLKLYTQNMRKSTPDFLGKSNFLVAGSLGSGNALWEISSKSVHPSYNGKKMLLEDSVKAMNAKKVYLMLGLNDVAVYGLEGTIQNYEKLVERIRKKSPDAKIYIQSATPMTRGGEQKVLNNTLLSKYNTALVEMCKKKGYHFLDIAFVLKDEQGYLPDAYSSDNYVHLTDKPCMLWIDYLYTHTIK